MKERDIEKYLVERVKALGGEVRKVQWVGRKSAPDRLVMLSAPTLFWANEIISVGSLCGQEHWANPLAGHVRKLSRTIWVELKNPDTIKTFPANPHERAQHREHERMRAIGQRVEVIGTKEQVDEVLR